MNFYLQAPPTISNYHIKGDTRHQLPTEAQLLSLWPLLSTKPPHTIFVSRKLYAPLLQNILTDYRLFEIKYPNAPFSAQNDTDKPVAFIPLKEFTL